MRKVDIQIDLKRIFEKAVLGIAIFVIFLEVCVLLNQAYLESDDWNRTLGRNYDFLGKNREINNLYVGCSNGIEPEAGAADQENKDTCILVSEDQSLGDSYFLLKQADRRYDLSHVYLLAGTDDMDGLSEKEEKYFNKIIAYCEKEEIVLEVVNG